VVATAGAALLRSWASGGGLGFWAGSVLIDADHYVWFCLRHRLWNPVAAVRFFNQAHPPHHAATRVLHSPAVLLAIVAAGARRPWLLPVALGMGLHVALDARHEAKMGRARAAALERDGFSCRACGTRGPDVGGHVGHQPWLLPSYRPENVTSLCRRCHDAAHKRGTGQASWT
jgi:hypothetical protein